jgi:ribonuclease HII
MLSPKYSNFALECGTDEVGRGCLSGPVVAAAVILPEGFHHPKLRDSKKMSNKAKEEVYEYVVQSAVSYGIAQVSVDYIEQHNILNASIQAMHEAIRLLHVKPEFLLVDGNQFHEFQGVPHECFVKGDDRFASIAAASVLAKVSRDRLMKKLSEKYPGYGWETNAGYGTKAHIDAIKSMGATPWHRPSFLRGIITTK